MKFTSVLILLAASFASVVAQEKIPAEKLGAISHKLIEQLGDAADVPVKIEPNADKSDGFTVQDAGVIVVPDKNFNAAALEKAGGRIVALGHLFFKDLAPAKDGKVAPADRLRPLTINDRDREYHVTHLLLGLRKQDDQWELVVFGKDDTPLLQLPLKKIEGKSQELPIEISGEKQDDDTGLLTLAILGQYKALLQVKRGE